ncbi:hypothetical protein [Sphingomonas mucosissima]|nr:hypothetical protein [Sphingomonas mucosissima]
MSKRYAVFCISWLLALPLWREFHEPSQTLWNVFLAAFLIATVTAVFLGMRYLEQYHIEVGEARFSSSNDERSEI